MPKQDELYAEVRQMSENIGYIKGKVESIEEQTKKTNGRVTKLERKNATIVIVGAVVLTALFILNPQIQEVIKAIANL